MQVLVYIPGAQMKLVLSLTILFAFAPTAIFAQTIYIPGGADKIEKQVDLDTYVREYKERQAKNAEGLAFTVKIKDNRKQFHLGEVITLELSFASSKPDTFTIDGATYDRSGRLHSDGFAIYPRDGAVDPVRDYFFSGLHAYSMGGLRYFGDLAEKPYVITAELNEWQRIDKPGHYRMYVVSNRVSRKRESDTNLARDASPLISNVIEFDVLAADEEWSTQKLNETLSAISKTNQDRGAACRTLRFLSTRAAVAEMRKRFIGDDNQCDSEYKFGLIGSPHREFVMRDMENAIALRNQPITSRYIDTLALLEFIKQVEGRPELEYARGDGERDDDWLTRMRRRDKFYQDLRLRYVRQLVSAIPQKQGQARAVSLQTLLDHRSELSTLEVSQWSTLFASLPDVFKLLTLHDQLFLLDSRWKPIASSAMLPVLRDVLKYSYDPAKKNHWEEGFNEFYQRDLRNVALRRLYELSPEEGRALILEEIRRPQTRVNIDVLRTLPEETLPELNSILIDNLDESRRKWSWYTNVITQLVERYATDKILSRMRAVYEAREFATWDCHASAALVAYFLRVAPPIGAEYLKKELAIRDAVPRCYQETLKNVAELHMSAEVEEVALASLDDEDSEVIERAAGVLAEYGTADSEKALWRRFEKWHDAMENRTEEERKERLNVDQERIELALREALTRGRAWLSDAEKLKRVRDLCISGTRRDEVEGMIEGWDCEIYVDATSFDDIPRFDLAQYQIKSVKSLKEKLLQFPKGTVFTWKVPSARGDDSRTEEVMQQIKSFLEEHGMKLKRESEKPLP